MTINLLDSREAAPSFEQLLEFAIQAGLTERARAARSGRAYFVTLEFADCAAVCALRQEAVIGEVPLKIARAIAASMSGQEQISVPVMELNLSEYPGPDGRTPRNPARSELSSTQLRLAGKKVFDYLENARLAPTVDYLYDDTTRSYSLQIFVNVKIR